MNFIKTPESDFADIEQRLRSTYAHVTNELGTNGPNPSTVPVGAFKQQSSKRRRFGVWAPRFATLGAVLGVAFAGVNLTDRGPASVINADESSVFKSFPHLVPTAPTGYHLDAIFRELTPLTGFQTQYRASSGRLPVGLVVGMPFWREAQTELKEQVIAGRMVLVNLDPERFSAQVVDKKCGTISIFGIKQADLLDTVRNLACRKTGQELQAELRNRKRSEIVFSGRIPSAYARLRFLFVSDNAKTDSFEIRVEPCQCGEFNVQFDVGTKTETRVIAGRRIISTVGQPMRSTPEGPAPDRNFAVWAPTSSASLSMNMPLNWGWTQIEAVVRGVREVDQATFTALLTSNGIKEVSLVP
jgi:hypothetical protein